MDMLMAREQRLGYLVELMEQSYVPAQTIPFFNMVCQGEWHLGHSTWVAKKRLKDLQKGGKQDGEGEEDGPILVSPLRQLSHLIRVVVSNNPIQKC